MGFADSLRSARQPALSGELRRGGNSTLRTWTSKVPKILAQYPTIRQYRQDRVQYLGAILLPILSVLGCWAIVLGILEVHEFLQQYFVRSVTLREMYRRPGVKGMRVLGQHERYTDPSPLGSCYTVGLQLNFHSPLCEKSCVALQGSLRRQTIHGLVS